MRPPTVALLLLAACTLSEPMHTDTRAWRDEPLDHGGEVDLTAPLREREQGADGTLAVTGYTEVPAGARLQGAYAVADAAARAELAHRLRVGVATLYRSEEGDGAARAERISVQVSSALLPGLPPPAHGWLRVRRDGTELLQVASQLRVQRAALGNALVGALRGEPEPEEKARQLLDSLAKVGAHGP